MDCKWWHYPSYHIQYNSAFGETKKLIIIENFLKSHFISWSQCEYAYEILDTCTHLRLVSNSQLA